MLVRAELPPSVFWTPFLFKNHSPVRWFVVGQHGGAVVVVRTGPRSIDVLREGGPLMPCGPEDVVNTKGIPAGAVVEFPGLRATILSTEGNECPSHVAFDLDRDLDAGTVLWVVEGPGGFQHVTPPGVGVGVRLAP